jgi:hypothetical protein
MKTIHGTNNFTGLTDLVIVSYMGSVYEPHLLGRVVASPLTGDTVIGFDSTLPLDDPIGTNYEAAKLVSSSMELYSDTISTTGNAISGLMSATRFLTQPDYQTLDPTRLSAFNTEDTLINIPVHDGICSIFIPLDKLEMREHGVNAIPEDMGSKSSISLPANLNLNSRSYTSAFPDPASGTDLLVWDRTSDPNFPGAFRGSLEFSGKVCVHNTDNTTQILFVLEAFYIDGNGNLTSVDTALVAFERIVSDGSVTLDLDVCLFSDFPISQVKMYHNSPSALYTVFADIEMRSGHHSNMTIDRPVYVQTVTNIETTRSMVLNIVANYEAVPGLALQRELKSRPVVHDGIEDFQDAMYAVSTCPYIAPFYTITDYRDLRSYFEAISHSDVIQGAQASGWGNFKRFLKGAGRGLKRIGTLSKSLWSPAVHQYAGDFLGERADRFFSSSNYKVSNLQPVRSANPYSSSADSGMVHYASSKRSKSPLVNSLPLYISRDPDFELSPFELKDDDEDEEPETQVFVDSSVAAGFFDEIVHHRVSKDTFDHLKTIEGLDFTYEKKLDGSYVVMTSRRSLLRHVSSYANGHYASSLGPVTVLICEHPEDGEERTSQDQEIPIPPFPVDSDDDFSDPEMPALGDLDGSVMIESASLTLDDIQALLDCVEHHASSRGLDPFNDDGLDFDDESEDEDDYSSDEDGGDLAPMKNPPKFAARTDFYDDDEYDEKIDLDDFSEFVEEDEYDPIKAVEKDVLRYSSGIEFAKAYLKAMDIKQTKDQLKLLVSGLVKVWKDAKGGGGGSSGPVMGSKSIDDFAGYISSYQEAAQFRSFSMGGSYIRTKSIHDGGLQYQMFPTVSSEGAPLGVFYLFATRVGFKGSLNDPDHSRSYYAYKTGQTKVFVDEAISAETRQETADIFYSLMSGIRESVIGDYFISIVGQESVSYATINGSSYHLALEALAYGMPNGMFLSGDNYGITNADNKAKLLSTIGGITNNLLVLDNSSDLSTEISCEPNPNQAAFSIVVLRRTHTYVDLCSFILFKTWALSLMQIRTSATGEGDDPFKVPGKKGKQVYEYKSSQVSKYKTFMSKAKTNYKAYAKAFKGSTASENALDNARDKLVSPKKTYSEKMKQFKMIVNSLSGKKKGTTHESNTDFKTVITNLLSSIKSIVSKVAGSPEDFMSVKKSGLKEITHKGTIYAPGGVMSGSKLLKFYNDFKDSTKTSTTRNFVDLLEDLPNGTIASMRHFNLLIQFYNNRARELSDSTGKKSKKKAKPKPIKFQGEDEGFEDFTFE